MLPASPSCPLLRSERNDGLYRVITYLCAKMVEELLLALLCSIIFGESGCGTVVRTGHMMQACLGGDLPPLRLADLLLSLTASLHTPLRPCHAANMVYWALQLQGSFALFWLVYYVSLCVGIGELCLPHSSCPPLPHR